MALSYLSGDMTTVGKSAKKQAKQADKKKKKATKKEEKKAKGGGVKKKIAKVALAPSREAFLVAVNLNLLKIGTKLARVWNKPGGKEELQKTWTGKFGGDFSRLQKAISKGSKSTVSGDEIGIAVEAAIATALPIIMVMAPLIKKFKAEGDANESALFDQGVTDGQKEMANSGEFETSEAMIPDGKTTGVVRSANGGSDGNEATQGNLFSPLGFCFKVPLMLGIANFENPIIAFIASLISTICVIGFIFYPVYEWNWFGGKKYIAPLYETPGKWFNNFFNLFPKWQRK